MCFDLHTLSLQLSRSPAMPQCTAHAGLVLEWVYGCIVSTAEKARDASQRCLSPAGPSLERAWSCLEDALKLQQGWQVLLSEARTLLEELHAAEAAAAAAGVYRRRRTASGVLPQLCDAPADGSAAEHAAGAPSADAAAPSLVAAVDDIAGREEVCRLLHAWAGNGAQEQAWLLAAAADGVMPAMATAAATALATAAASASISLHAEGSSSTQGHAAAWLAQPVRQAPLVWPGDEAIACALRLELARIKAATHALVCEASVAGQVLAALGPRLKLYEPSLQGLIKQLDDCTAARTAGRLSSEPASAAAAGAPAATGARGSLGSAGSAAATSGGGNTAIDRLLQIEALLKANLASRGGAAGASGNNASANGVGGVGGSGPVGSDKLKWLEEDLARRVLQLRQMYMQQVMLQRASEGFDHLLAIKASGRGDLPGRSIRDQVAAASANGAAAGNAAPGSGEEMHGTHGPPVVPTSGQSVQVEGEGCGGEMSSNGSPVDKSHHLAIGHASNSPCDFRAAPCLDTLPRLGQVAKADVLAAHLSAHGTAAGNRLLLLHAPAASP